MPLRPLVTLATVTTVTALLELTAAAASFHTIDNVATNMVDGNPGGNPLTNIYEGAGVGFDATEPHNALGGVWYTDAPGGFPSDYISVHDGPEYIWLDLGADVPVAEISFWGYSSTNSNGLREFNLSFATDAEGGDTGILGDEEYATSIPANPAFEAIQDPLPRQSFSFPAVIARYVRVEATSTFYNQPGAGAGGDRLGIGEIAFEDIVITEGPDIRYPAEVMLELLADDITEFTITITNAGDAELTVSSTPITGTDGPAFTITGFTPPIGPVSSQNISLEFDPAGLGGAVSATLTINSNDPDTPSAMILMTGSLPPLGAEISVPANVSLSGDGNAETVLVGVTNVGQAPLGLSAASVSGPNAAAYTVTILPPSVEPGATANIELAFDPTGLPIGAVMATLQITSDDPDSPMVDVILDGGIPEQFYTIEGLTSATEAGGADFYAAPNLIQGAGVGFAATWPHDALGFGADFSWVTNDPNGGTGDYFDPLPAVSPVMVFDLGSDVGLEEISFWGYADTNANGANLFSLRFATDADGENGFGTTISYNPSFAPIQDQTIRQSFEFDEGVFARYVEWVPLDNFFGINPPGGDRVGAGEVAFAIRAVAGNQFRITDITYAGGDVSFTFTSRPGADYGIYRSTDLTVPWEELDDSFTSQGELTEFVDDSVPAGATRVFYRVGPGGG